LKNFILKKIIILSFKISIRFLEEFTLLITKKNIIDKSIGLLILGYSNRINNFARKLKKLSAFIYPYTSLNDTETVLSKYAPDLLSNKTFYVEAGANDGINQSNTFFLEYLYGAKGVLIEPSPSLFEECRFNRNSNNIFENCALGNPLGKNETLEFIYSGLMTISTKIENIDPFKHAASGQKFTNIKPYKFIAPHKKLKDILKNNKIDHVDLLSLDLEGGELEALKGADLIGFKYKYILVECRQKEEMKLFMKKNGYKIVCELGILDILFKKFE